MAEEEVANTTDKGGGYGKRPMWQWILIYVVVGLVIYGLIYYFVFAKKAGGGYNYSGSQSTQQGY